MGLPDGWTVETETVERVVLRMPDGKLIVDGDGRVVDWQTVEHAEQVANNWAEHSSAYSRMKRHNAELQGMSD